MADGREEAGEEEEEEGFGSVQERAMFLLDLGKGDLFESVDGGAETRLEFAMKIVLAFIKGRLVGGAASKDVVGLAACGDGRGGAAGRTIFGLGPPSAKVARPPCTASCSRGTFQKVWSRSSMPRRSSCSLPAGAARREEAVRGR